MPAFEYVALDLRGHEKKGIIEGDTARQVRHILREKNWTPISVKSVSSKTAEGKSTGFFKKSVSISDLMLFTRQLSTLVQASLPLEKALQAVADQTEKAHVQSMLMEVRSGVLEGNTLANSLAGYPHVFSHLYRSTVSAGEHAGHLDIVLERLADYTEARQGMAQKIQLALLYPIIITVLSVLIVTGLLAYVVPSVTQVFQETGQKLPALTVALISLSDFVRNYGLYFLGGIVAILVGFRMAMRGEKFRYAFHQKLLQLPLLGKVIRGTETARFARTLSILNASGVPLLEALRISGEVLNSLPIRKAVAEATKRVSEGTSLKTALETGGHFPPMALHMIASGEASGELEAMLDRVAHNQEREFENLMSGLLGLIAPVMVVIMGGVVLLIVLAILLPIFELNEMVGK
ncbi:MAG: type II secretion system inner membrane protein GspF [Gammaproteobacteria bacterium]|nr:type II secretion system inner membrane protein GspF [Gammaproteobacteria bacterium]